MGDPAARLHSQDRAERGADDVPARPRSAPRAGCVRTICIRRSTTRRRARRCSHMMDQTTVSAGGHRAGEVLTAPATPSSRATVPTPRRRAPSRSPSRTSTGRGQLVKESGYDGRPVMVIHVTDIALLNGAALVTRELLTQIGFNVDLKAMDWSTNLATPGPQGAAATRAAGTCSTPGGWPPTSCIPPSTSGCRGPGPAPGSAGRKFPSSRS